MRMTVQLTAKKMANIKALAFELLKGSATIAMLAQFVGKLVATEPGFTYAPLHYKFIEIFKNEQLKFHRGNYDALVVIPENILVEIRWWHDGIEHLKRHIIVPSPSHYITSDSSNTGWGGIINNEKTARGRWGSADFELHINVKELTAAFFMLKTYCRDLTNVHIRIKMDNVTAISCVQKMASRKYKLMCVTREMWQWARDRQIILSAEFIAGRLNHIADSESRVIENTDTEWMLNTMVFDRLCENFGRPAIDLFATRINAQLTCYYAWRPDPDALAIDAFQQSWSHTFTYAFCPFSVIGRTLQKLRGETQATLLLVAPMWKTQLWWPTALKMLMAPPLILPRNCLVLPQSPDEKFPLKKMSMIAMLLSSDPSKRRDYRTDLCKFYPQDGDVTQISNIPLTSQNSVTFVSKGDIIVCKQI